MMCVDTIKDTSTPLCTQSDVSIFMLSDMQCMTSYVSHTICCNMKIIGITEEPDVLLSDNQRLREQIIILTNLRRHDSVVQAKKR